MMLQKTKIRQKKDGTIVVKSRPLNERELQDHRRICLKAVKVCHKLDCSDEAVKDFVEIAEAVIKDSLPASKPEISVGHIGRNGAFKTECFLHRIALVILNHVIRCSENAEADETIKMLHQCVELSERTLNGRSTAEMDKIALDTLENEITKRMRNA